MINSVKCVYKSVFFSALYEYIWKLTEDDLNIYPFFYYQTLAKESAVPVINALSEKYHPTQILADLMTLHEYYHNKQNNVPAGVYSAHTQHPRETLKGLKVAWVGDANNILQEILVAFPKCGISVSAACPAGYVCDQDVIDIAHADAKKTGATVVFTTSPEEAVKNCDVIVTDTW